ncbi:unnamed protein product [Clonostachys chloroleuca]|uniref:Crh-like protein n=1 Tax=Clonostachys chloroleuca TaxID=1926264 RepID=A0AA35PW69_9HYPO|nr:unnamed protein product [Clonostachys chloroleuca]
MFAKSFGAVVCIFATSVVSQTYTDCNPTEKTCDPAPALGNLTIDCDFTQGACSDFTAASGTTITYDDNGALFSIENDTQAPTLSTSRYIFFGRVEVQLKAAVGQGIITSVVLQSADLDEIDWEWFGGKDTEVESNYFGKGDTTTYDREEYHDVTTPLSTYHNYTIEWTSSKVEWLIDSVVVRTLNYADAESGTRFPQTPMQLKIGTWAGGLSTNSEGTIEWAGGVTDFSKAPFQAWYKSVSVVDYAGGNSSATESITEYVYSDTSGSYESITVVKGESVSVENLTINNSTSLVTTASGSNASNGTTGSNSTTTSTSSTTAAQATSATSTVTTSNDAASGSVSTLFAICAAAIMISAF